MTIDAQDPWPRSIKLLAALEAGSGQTGRLVRDTCGVDIRFRLLHYEAQGKKGSNARNVVDWYLRALRACPALVRADIVFSTVDDFSNALHALNLLPRDPSSLLRPASSSISKLSLDFVPKIPHIVDHTEIFELLRRTPIHSLRSLSLYDIGWFFCIPTPTSSHFPLLIGNLRILTKHTSDLTKCLPFLSSSPLPLQNLSIVMDVLSEGVDLLSLSKLVDGTLKSLAFAAQPHAFPQRLTSISTYTSGLHGPRIPPKVCESFPLLSSLTLTGTHGPSLALLQILVISSPLLSHISFPHSRWICSYNPSSPSPDEIFPESEISAELKKFLHLKHIHFGYLPTADPLRYEGMKKELETSGIKVEYQICT